MKREIVFNIWALEAHISFGSCQTPNTQLDFHIELFFFVFHNKTHTLTKITLLVPFNENKKQKKLITNITKNEYHSTIRYSVSFWVFTVFDTLTPIDVQYTLEVGTYCFTEILFFNFLPILSFILTNIIAFSFIRTKFKELITILFIHFAEEQKTINPKENETNTHIRKSTNNVSVFIIFFFIFSVSFICKCFLLSFKAMRALRSSNGHVWWLFVCTRSQLFIYLIFINVNVYIWNTIFIDFLF